MPDRLKRLENLDINALLTKYTAIYISGQNFDSLRRTCLSGQRIQWIQEHILLELTNMKLDDAREETLELRVAAQVRQVAEDSENSWLDTQQMKKIRESSLKLNQEKLQLLTQKNRYTAEVRTLEAHLNSIQGAIPTTHAHVSEHSGRASSSHSVVHGHRSQGHENPASIQTRELLAQIDSLNQSLSAITTAESAITTTLTTLGSQMISLGNREERRRRRSGLTSDFDNAFSPEQLQRLEIDIQTSRQKLDDLYRSHVDTAANEGYNTFMSTLAAKLKEGAPGLAPEDRVTILEIHRLMQIHLADKQRLKIAERDLTEANARVTQISERQSQSVERINALRNNNTSRSAENAQIQINNPVLTQEKNAWVLMRNQFATLTLVAMILSVFTAGIVALLIPTFGMVTIIEAVYILAPTFGMLIAGCGIASLVFWIKSGSVQNQIDDNSTRFSTNNREILNNNQEISRLSQSSPELEDAWSAAQITLGQKRQAHQAVAATAAASYERASRYPATEEPELAATAQNTATGTSSVFGGVHTLFPAAAADNRHTLQQQQESSNVSHTF
jgi:hypothetical protein